MKKRHVIYIVESGGLCGGVRVILEQLNYLRNRGWHVEVYSLDQSRPNWFPLRADIPWWRFDSYSHMARHLIQRDAIKVATWWKTAFPVAESSKDGEGFYLVQDIETSYYTQPAMKEQVKKSYDLGLTAYTTSHWVEENLPRCEYVGIGIDQALYRPLDIQRQLNAVLSCGRPQLLKGWADHCEVYRRLRQTQQFALYQFGVMGAALPYASVLPRGISDEELVHWYNRCGIFVSTSLHEGFSLTLLEAMACGAIVICTNADGNMQFCENGVNSIITEPGQPQQIVEACINLLENPEQLLALQARGLETAKQWTWEPVIDRLEALFYG